MTLKRIELRIFLLNLFVVALFAGIHSGASCQDDKGKHQFIMYVTAPTRTMVSEEISDEYGIGNKAWTMELGIQTKLYGLIGISGALGYGGIKDYNPFSQNTTWGNLESSFSVLSYDFKAGPWTPVLRLSKQRELNLSAGASIGFEGFSGRREIVNCEDCEVEKFKFNGGFFVEPEIHLFFYKNLLGVGTSYRYFFGYDDLIGGWTILKMMVRFDLINEISKKGSS